MSESKLSSFLLPKQEHLLKVVPVQELQLILLQGISLKKSESTLYSIGLPVVKELWQLNLHQELPGWPSLQIVVDGKASFTCFEDATLPVSKGLYLYDLKEKKWLLRAEDLSMVNAQDKDLLIRKEGEEDHYYTLSLVDLSLKILDNPAKWFKKVQLSKPATSNVQYPYHIGEENPLYKDLTDFVFEKTAHSLVGMVEYLEWSDQRMLVSYYIEGVKGMDQYLLVTDKIENVVVHECIDQELKGMALDVFMVMNNQCIYIKNKTQLCVYNLV